MMGLAPELDKSGFDHHATPSGTTIVATVPGLPDWAPYVGPIELAGNLAPSTTFAGDLTVIKAPVDLAGNLAPSTTLAATMTPLRDMAGDLAPSTILSGTLAPLRDAATWRRLLP